MISKVEVVEKQPEVIVESEQTPEPVLETKSLEVEDVSVPEPVAAPVELVAEPVLVPKSLPTVENIEAALLEVIESPPIAEELPIVEQAVEVEEVVEEPVAAPVIAIEEVIKAVAPPKSSAEATFEQYRQAMLHTGPRDLEKQARVEMQSKGGLGNSALWRAQTASLRKSLGNDDAADFLERANFSVNDRVISSFNAYRHA
jgi:hypothetical protein